MNPWFDEKTAGIIGGILGSVIGIWGGGVLGGMSWFYIKKGWKKLACSLYIFTIAAGFVLLGIGITGLLFKQPWYVWWPFFLCGLITTVVIGSLLLVLLRLFAQREQQIMEIHDL